MDPNKVEIVLGPPGTGKTTDLLRTVESALAAGVRPNEIGYFSFTKKAAEEGKVRAMQKFGFTDQELPYFKTLHALAFQQLGLSRNRVFNWSHTLDLGKKLGLDFKGKEIADDDVYGMNTADRLLFMEQLSRNSMRPLKEVWNAANEDDVDYFELDRLSRAMVEYKRANALVDFTDMLEIFVADRHQTPKFKLLMIDEAQDLSALQWLVVDKLAESSERVHVAGDDDQALYQWAGGNVKQFIALDGSVRVLDKSYRVPSSVHGLANKIVVNIGNRRQKTWRPKADIGQVNWFESAEDVDLSKGTWLLLARNGYMLNDLEDWCMTQGFSFHSVNRDPLKSQSLQAIKFWETLRRGNTVAIDKCALVMKFLGINAVPNHVKWLASRQNDDQISMQDLVDAGIKTTSIWHEALVRISPKERDYFIAARKRNEPLLKEPRIKISTIHAAKGGEADHVLLLTDMSYRSYVNMESDPDSEARVFFVATTRSRETLNLITPKTDLCYEL